MPPSKHSGSSKSAHKDSDQMSSDQNYTLGEYSFSVVRSAGTSPNYDKIEAICTKGGKNARKSIQVPSSTLIDGWYVEANDTTADVYVILKNQEIPIGDFSYTEAGAWTYSYYNNNTRENVTDNLSSTSTAHVAYFDKGSTGDMVFASFSRCDVTNHVVFVGAQGSRTSTESYSSSSASWKGQTFYYGVHYYASFADTTRTGTSIPVNSPPSGYSTYNAAVKMLFGNEEESETKLVGRFAIDLGDAGGDGPGSDWEDPGDYDPDWEEGEPTHTLYVTVTGALSGRHNDPIVDPSYSYIPADKNTVKDYGCGGDGGHGGGGGAGASTVVIHKFATNQANSKEVTAIARRHGYGSGGGKGGKGGDGCILVYY